MWTTLIFKTVFVVSLIDLKHLVDNEKSDVMFDIRIRRSVKDVDNIWKKDYVVI